MFHQKTLRHHIISYVFIVYEIYTNTHWRYRRYIGGLCTWSFMSFGRPNFVVCVCHGWYTAIIPTWRRWWRVCRRLAQALRKPYLVILYNGHWLNCIGWILIINNNGYARRRFRVDGWGWFSHLNGYLCFSFWSISPRKTVVTHLGYYYKYVCVGVCL